MVLGFRMVFIARKLSLATKWKPLRSTSKETSKVAVVASFVNGLAAMKMITSPRGNEGVPVNQVAVSEAERVLCIGVWLELVIDQEEG